MPSSTAGEEATGPPVLKVHVFAPVAAFSAWTMPSSAPTYAVPSTTAGVDSAGPPSVSLQRTASADGGALSGLNRVCAASKPNDCQFAEHAESTSPSNADAVTTRPRRETNWWIRDVMFAAPGSTAPPGYAPTRGAVRQNRR